MVTTRRQSGKLPAPSIPAQLDESSDEEGDADCSDIDMADVSEASASEFSEDSALAKRPLKKAKTSSSTKNTTSSSTLGRTRPSRLAMLPTMPLDILYEVFGHLHPLDLVHLSRISKGLRRILMSRQSISVWKSARHRVKGLPECPDDISEPHYARLAFESSCHGCGKSRTFKIDWRIRIRGCQSCLRNLLVWSTKFEKRYPDFPREIMDLLPYTMKSSSSNGHDTRSRFFWEPAILAMAQRLEDLEDNVMLKESGAVEALKKFKADKEAQLPKIFAHARLCESWALVAAVDRSTELESAQIRRKDAIEAKLRQLNWPEYDISAVHYHSAFTPAQDLTDRIWTRIRPEIEDERQKIIELRKSTALANRRKTVDSIYLNFLNVAPMSLLATQPRLPDVYAFKGFAEIIGAPLDVVVPVSDFNEVKKDLTLLITQWANVQKQNLLSLLPTGLSDAQHTVSSLKLATSVFKCGSCLDAVLATEALAHTCRDETAPFKRDYHISRNLTFWSAASSVIRDILTSLRYDPRTTIGDILDLVDPRLFCLACAPSLSKNGKPCRYARTWRSCVVHFCDAHAGITKTERQSNWQALDQEQTRQVKAAEGFSADDQLFAWYCNICTTSTRRDLRSKRGVFNHISTKHQKTDPVLGVDMCRDLNIPRAHSPILYGDPQLWAKSGSKKNVVDPSKAFRCMRCHPTSNRLFVKQGVYSHLQAKHNVTNPVEPGDYKDTRTPAS